MGFEWSIKNDNETINVPDFKSIESSSGQAASFLILSDNFNVQRTYRCAANNSVGVGTICEIEVAGNTSTDLLTIYAYNLKNILKKFKDCT